MPKKVFELAKELEVKPLDLVEELKSKGFDSIKNHMSVLSDEDLSKYEALKTAESEAQEAEAATKKKTKKKTTKKKAKTTKKATKKAATAKDGEKATKKKAKTVKKKTVIRRKSGEKDAPEAAPAEEVLETKVEDTAPEVVETPATEAQEEQATSGLQVVSRPEAKEEAAPEEKEEKKELYKEKVHKFTPVFIPEKKEEPEERKTTGQTGEVEYSEDDDKKGDNKKKLGGGLAAMMSGKKANVSKSALLTQTRADSEMKSYAALSGSGRPIYTQVKKKRVYTGATNKTEITEVKDSKRVVGVHGGATVVELAKKLKVKSKELVDKALELNLLLKNEDFLGITLASEIASLYGYRVEDKKFDEAAVLEKEVLSEEQKSNLPLRNPIITIMGHVDHGKTTLLDHIRKAKVVDGEAGGITQHIGAYSVNAGGKTLTFLDTPGHAAFASMRQRGADVTDIVVLVVAADDGVMPQTKESIKFCENSGCPIIIAVNKMDKEAANPDRVKSELSEHNLAPEDWGGQTQYFPISALKGDGVDELLEGIALQAEMMELRADPKGKAEGIVIESKIEQGRGPMATILVQKGTLKKGDTLVVGETFGRARSLMDSTGGMLTQAGPSMPIQILGLNEAPSPGDTMNVAKNERDAKKIVQSRVDERKKLASVPTKKQVSLEDFFASAPGDGVEQKTLNLIIRTDVQGSFEAIKQALEPLANSEVDVKVIGGGVGPITDSDIQLADSSGAVVIGFGMRPVTTARRLSEEKGIDVKTYTIIYELIDDVKAALEGLLDPDTEEKFIGRAEVKDTFMVPKVGQIAGSLVVDGKIQVGCHIRLLRGGKIMFDGELSSLKRFKDDVKEVKNGLECGIGLKDYNDLKNGDLFEAYMLVEKKRTLEDVEMAELEKAEAAASMAEEVENETSL